MSDNLRILQVNTSNYRGGAEQIAARLHAGLLARGHDPWMALGWKHGHDPRAVVIRHDNTMNPWSWLWWRVYYFWQTRIGRMPGVRTLCDSLSRVAVPAALIDDLRGRENFRFPGTHHLRELLPGWPDIVHGHNLHSDYFDLRVLPALSAQAPVLLTLHDAWLLSGHCAHSFTCERWRSGCGKCPDLIIYPALLRDGTAWNWARKRDIYAKSRLYIATPSRWLMDKVQDSMLAPGMVEGRVIPNGIDLTIFKSGDREKQRRTLGIPQDACVLAFAANGIRANAWKDYRLLREAVGTIAERMGDRPVHFLAIGEQAPPEQVGKAVVRFIPFQSAPDALAGYYQAADVYLHAARADTFPSAVLEALACGVPVVATAVGGIPEQVDEGETGFLTLPGDARAMAEAAVRILAAPDLRARLSANAAAVAAARFDEQRMIDDYLSWYQEILARWEAKPAPASLTPDA